MPGDRRQVPSGPRADQAHHIRSSDYTIRLLTLPLERKLRPLTIVDAQFSMPWQASMALIDGKVDVDTFTEENLSNKLALELIPKVDWVCDEEFERRYPAYYSCSVTVSMNDGAEYTAVIDNPKGDYRNPMTDEEIEAKFAGLARREIAAEGRIGEIVGCVRHLDEVKDVNALFALLER